MNKLLAALTLSFTLLAGAAAAETPPGPDDVPSQAAAEEQETFRPKTLIGDRAASWGGFGSPVIKGTSLGGGTAILVGGRGAAVLNHTVAIGGGGFGLAGRRDDLAFGYGGPSVNVIFFPESLVHFDVGALVGWGGARTGSLETGVFVLEPEVNLELNITHNMRLALGASYRHVTEVSGATGIAPDFSGFTGTLALRFGTF